LTTATHLLVADDVAAAAADDIVRLECFVWRAVARAAVTVGEAVGETQSEAGSTSTALRRRRGDDVLPILQLDNNK